MIILTHLKNIGILLGTAILCLTLLMFSVGGVLETFQTLDSSKESVNLIISIIVLALTLSLLCLEFGHGSTVKTYQTLGKTFAGTAIVFFITLISAEGMSSQIFSRTPAFLKLPTLAVLVVSTMFALIWFVSSLFILLLQLLDLIEKFQKDATEAKKWFTHWKYRKVVTTTLITSYTLYLIYQIIMQPK